tara:strand:+ start:946 stop:1152 length:207 start_codon:yes stop_codon:yes gene_type:complete
MMKSLSTVADGVSTTRSRADSPALTVRSAVVGTYAWPTLTAMEAATNATGFRKDLFDMPHTLRWNLLG